MNTAAPLPTPKCEREDAHPGVAAMLAGSIAVIVGVCLLGGWITAGREANRGAGLPATNGVFQHGSQERTDIDLAWQTLSKDADRDPQAYAWIDRRAGIVHIPIDRAIDLVCAEQKSTFVTPRSGHPRNE